MFFHYKFTIVHIRISVNKSGTYKGTLIYLLLRGNHYDTTSLPQVGFEIIPHYLFHHFHHEYRCWMALNDNDEILSPNHHKQPANHERYLQTRANLIFSR